MTITLEIALKEIVKRAEDMPRGMWIFASGQTKLYLIELDAIQGELYDADFRFIRLVAYTELSLNVKDLTNNQQ